MRFFILFILAASISNSFALTVGEAFKKFYNHEKISSRHCGRNIHFFLQYLNENKVKYNSGYVVSIHEDEVSVPHFDGRWATSEKYSTGESYYLSKWYFHVFAVIDGVAYDFSQREAKTQKLLDYLKTSYIPRGETEMISISGTLNEKKAYTKYLNTKLKIYDLDTYADDFGPSLYEGSFIELFRYAEGDPIISSSTVHNKIDFEEANEIRTGIWSFANPRGYHEEKSYPLRAEPLAICRGYGFWGSLTSGLEYQVSDQVEMLKTYSFIPESNYKKVEDKLFPISYRIMKSNRDQEKQALSHYASRVVCSDLYSIIK